MFTFLSLLLSFLVNKCCTGEYFLTPFFNTTALQHSELGCRMLAVASDGLTVGIIF